MEKLWRNEDRMRELYVDQKLSITQVAERLDCGSTTVGSWLERHGIERRSISEGTTIRKREENESERCMAVELYQDGKRPVGIAEELDRPIMTVRYWLYQADVMGDDHPCPTCGKGFDTENGMKVHHAKAHDESISGVEIECEWCGSKTRIPRYHREENGRGFCDKGCHAEWVSGFMEGVNAGENHPLWNGGEYEYGEGWNETKRQRVRDRDGYQCVDCGMTQEEHLEEYNRKLPVHHIVPARRFNDPEMRNDGGNLVTLCTVCHQSKWEGLPMDYSP